MKKSIMPGFIIGACVLFPLTLMAARRYDGLRLPLFILSAVVVVGFFTWAARRARHMKAAGRPVR